jgi:hypothetical protein
MKLEFDLNDDMFRDMVVRSVTASLRDYVARWSTLPAVASATRARCDELVDNAVLTLLEDGSFVDEVVKAHITRKIRARIDDVVRQAKRATSTAQARDNAQLAIAAESLVRQHAAEDGRE